MKKILTVFTFIILLLGFIFPSRVFSQTDFINDIVVNYAVSEDGVTTVTYNITLINNISDYYAAGYGLTITGTKPINPRSFQGDKQLALEKSESAETTSLKIKFEDAVVGLGNRRNFSISFEDNTLAIKTGEVWEVNIPKLASTNQFNNYYVRLTVPPNFGELAYISPQASSIESTNDRKIYIFDKTAVSKTGVTAAFGQFQVFEFDLTYHLENPLNKVGIVEVAIPPDTAYQKVNYKSLTPAPETVTIDNDGNWLAIYKLNKRERIDVKAVGVVQIFSGPRYETTLSPEDRAKNLQSTEVWQTNSQVILDAAKNLTTPRQIYDYVVGTLNYDYDRVKPNVIRLGAEQALLNPRNAICMEFTDTFVALARARGIPAREINGFAYTENTQIQPLSLVNDVLHSWPEYWDEDKKDWIPVDPTWGNTTGGVDFFSKLDLRHFTFVIHGTDSYKPYPPGSYKLGSTPQKDVFVNFGKLPDQRNSNPQITARIQETLPGFASRVLGTITNPGPTSIENRDIEIYFDAQKVYSKKVTILPPYANVTFEQKIPFSFLGNNTPSQIEVIYGSGTQTLGTSKSTVIIVSLVITLVLIFLSILYFLIKTIRKGKGSAKKQNQNQDTSQEARNKVGETQPEQSLYAKFSGIFKTKKL